MLIYSDRHLHIGCFGYKAREANMRRIHWTRTEKHSGCMGGRESCYDSLVGLVELHDLLLQFFGLVGGEAQLADVVAGQLLWVVVSQLRLSRVGAQNGVGGKGAGKTTRHHVISQLQTQIVPGVGQRKMNERRDKCTHLKLIDQNHPQRATGQRHNTWIPPLTLWCPQSAGRGLEGKTLRWKQSSRDHLRGK